MLPGINLCCVFGAQCQLYCKTIQTYWFEHFRLKDQNHDQACQACRAKEVFRKFVDSVLQKSARVRSLTVDLKKNYYEDETAMKILSYHHSSDCFASFYFFVGYPNSILTQPWWHGPFWSTKGCRGLGRQLEDSRSGAQFALRSHGKGWARGLFARVARRPRYTLYHIVYMLRWVQRCLPSIFLFGSIATLVA